MKVCAHSSLKPRPATAFRYFTEVARTVLDGTTVIGATMRRAPRPLGVSCAHASTTPRSRSVIARRRNCYASIYPALSPDSLELPESERVTSIAAHLKRAGQRHRHRFANEGAAPAPVQMSRRPSRYVESTVALAKKYPAWLVERACDHAMHHHLSADRVATARVLLSPNATNGLHVSALARYSQVRQCWTSGLQSEEQTVGCSINLHS
jgi:hypothetical protein